MQEKPHDELALLLETSRDSRKPILASSNPVTSSNRSTDQLNHGSTIPRLRSGIEVDRHERWERDPPLVYMAQKRENYGLHEAEEKT